MNVYVLPADASVSAATRVQRMERGRQARSLRKLAPPFSPQQRRQLEDALSAAVNTAMGLAEHSERLGFIARHIVARNDGKTLPEAPPRKGKLGEEQPPLNVGMDDVLHRRPPEALLVEVDLLRDVVNGQLRRDVAHGARGDRAEEGRLALAVAPDEPVDAPAHEGEGGRLEQVAPAARVGRAYPGGADRARVALFGLI